jgi:hypothetical protein
MNEIKKFDDFLNEKKWIKGAIEHPGALRKHFHKEGEEKITQTEIKDEIASLMRKDLDKKKEGIQLDKRDAKLYKRLNLAKTLMDMNEGDHDTQNYMFFANISNIKRMCEEIMQMDKMEVDRMLSDGHGWATDHVATSKDDVEEVYNFLYASMDLKSN